MQKTTNYQLCQWDGEDRILRTDFNEDNAKIDAALKSHANSIATINSTLPGKADAATVTSLSNKLNTEIQNRKDADTAEANARAQADNTEKAAREAADTAEAQARAQGDAALTAAMAFKGNCQIYYATYVGDGADNKTLTFPAMPLAVMIQTQDILFPAVRGATQVPNASRNPYRDFFNVTWSGNSLTWECGSDGGGANYPGYTYHVVALLTLDQTAA